MYSPKEDEYFEIAAYEASAAHMRFIEEYDDQVFWPELSNRLAERDFVEEEMLRGEGSRAEEERTTRLFEITERYEEEFAGNGLDNFRLVLEVPRVH